MFVLFVTSFLLLSSLCINGMESEPLHEPESQISLIMQDYVSEELKVLFAQNQQIRARMAREEKLVPRKQYFYELSARNRAHVTKLKKIIAQYGWPCMQKFDAVAAHSAWMMALNADEDPDFQFGCLKLMIKEMEQNHILPYQIAFLTDRFRVNRNLPQEYGTQLDENGQLLLPIAGFNSGYLTDENFEALNEKREVMGLNSLQEYLLDAYKNRKGLQ